jgi:hypothetical protein
LQDGETAARLLSYYAVPKTHLLVENFVAAMRDDDILREEFSYIIYTEKGSSWGLI